MRRGVLLLLFISFAFAIQIREIQVLGADPILTTLVKIALPVQEGEEVNPEDLPQLAHAVRNTGYFEDVKIELRDGILLVKVQPNPPIAEIKIEARAFPPEKLAAYLADRLALTPGTTYNPQKAQEAKKLLAELYRQQGFPFSPEVKIVTERQDDGIHLHFQVEENPPLTGLRIVGAHWVPIDQIKAVFTPLIQKKKFSWQLYREAVQKVNSLYAERGFRGSGVDLQRTYLAEGVLTLSIRELKVIAVDKDGLPQSPVHVGDPFNYDLIVQAIAELARYLGREIDFDFKLEKDGVRVRLSFGEKSPGLIREIRIVGATAFSENELKAQLIQKPGDPFSPQLAKVDFERLLAFYRKAGYVLVPKPDFSFKEGVYTIRIQEVKIAGYRLEWQGRHRTRDIVILWELPKPGALFSIPAIRKGIGKVLRLGILAGPPEVLTEKGPRDDLVIVVFRLKEAKTVSLAPAIAWSNQSGWSGQVSLSDKNLWGLAHKVNVNLSFIENDAGDNLSFNFSYQIPTLYIDVAELRPTSLRFTAYSNPYGDFKLKDKEGNETGWEYTERRTGATFSISRSLSDHLNIEFGVEGQWAVTELETRSPPENAPYSEEEAKALLPPDYINALVSTTLTYSNVDNPFYPTYGLVTQAHVGYGLVFPNTGETQHFAPLWAIYKGYATQDPAKRWAFAIRLASGMILGSPPESRYFSMGGSEPELTMLRGYSPRSFKGTRLIGASVEYRYDFQFESTLTRTVIGILFADVGSTWNPGDYLTLHSGVGFGVQLNLGYGAIQFPAIRLDYGFSTDHPTGVLHFRIGPVF